MREFTAKILLFGEYSVIHGSEALVIPFNKYKGRFTFSEQPRISNNILSNRVLQSLYEYLDLKKLWSESGLDKILFHQDIKKGLYFSSDIPSKYGLGSSGALVAALYDRYGNIKSDQMDLEKTLNKMAVTESFFHGISSAIDPLCIFLNKPLLFKNKTPTIVAFEDLNISLSHFYLLDSGIEAETGKFIKIFNSLLNEPSFKHEYDTDYISAINSIYNEIVQNDKGSLNEIIRKISIFQLKHFTDMIPETIREIWEKGITTQEYYIKLCGSGGGGFFLLYSLKDLNVLRKQLGNKLYPVIS